MTETTKAPALEPHAVASDEGEARWWFAALAVIKATSADTGGLMTIVEMTEPPGAEAPLHVHYREDEAFWILAGDVTLQVGDATIEASAGDYAFGPRGIPHKYTVGAAGCRMLFICTPGGFEELVRDMSEPAKARTLPPPSEAPPDIERMAAIAAEHGCELLAGDESGGSS
jgi:quercetin dioxygenase-like cupin family protein